MHRRVLGGTVLPIAVDELRVLLKGFNARTGARVSAVVTRSGVPIAWALPEDMQVDNFATMAATLLGALEVIYSTMKEPAPEKALVQTDGGTLAVRTITSRMFFVALSEGKTSDMEAAVEETATRARGFLSKES
ncbi:MAG: roadblock/LC7 domain-containing protein [Candidatus Thermoplasmatota archaeon]